MRASVASAAWGKSWPAAFPLSGTSSGASYPITFPAVPLRIRAELFLGGVWVDITQYIYYEPRVRIKRGRTSESARAQPSQCSIRLKNPDRIWSPRNTNGLYYGLLNRNVKFRVWVNPGDGDHLRFTGFVSQWPQQWTTGNHRWVDLQAHGVLKRLGQGKSALRTPIYRAVTSQNPYAYWTLKETSDALVGASEIEGGSPLQITGDIAFGAFTDTPDNTASIKVNSGYGAALVTPAQPVLSAGFIFGFGMKMNGVPADAFIDYPMLKFTSSAFFTTWEFLPQLYDGIIPMQLTFRDSFNTSSALVNMTPAYNTEQAVNEQFDDVWHYYQVVVKPVGFNTDVKCYYDGEFQGGITVPTPSLSVAAGSVVSYEINPRLRDWSALNLSFSDISVIALNAVNDDSQAFAAFVGETPTARFARLCTEEGIPATVLETFPDNETMGPQAVDTLLNLLRECEAVNEGVLDEDFEGRLRLISRTYTWNQPPAMAIDYTSGAIKDGFKPTDDDLLVRNDWTVTRKGGNARRWTQTSGPLNVNDPVDDPQGVNRYDDSATLNVETDDQALQHASLRTARGTIDEIRIAEMPLHFSSAAGIPLLSSWLQMDINTGFRINNTPVDMGSIPSNQIMAGYDESIDRLEWRTALYGAPASNDQVGTLDQFGYLDCRASTLDEDLTLTETLIDVRCDDECYWVNTSVPFNIIIGGEEITVRSVGAASGAGTSWTQTLTTTRSVNGVVKTHAIGEEIHVAQPFIMAM